MSKLLVRKIENSSITTAMEKKTAPSSKDDPRDVIYEIGINTSWRGTDSKVYFQIHGLLGSTAKLQIGNSDDNFEPNGNKFEYFYWASHVNNVGDVGAPYAIEISAPTAKKWGVEMVRVTRVVCQKASRDLSDKKRVDLQRKTNTGITVAEFPTDRRIGSRSNDHAKNDVLFWENGLAPTGGTNSQLPIHLATLWTGIINRGSKSQTIKYVDKHILTVQDFHSASNSLSTHNEVNITESAGFNVEGITGKNSIGFKSWLETNVKTENSSTVTSELSTNIEFNITAKKQEFVIVKIMIMAAANTTTFKLGKHDTTLTVRSPTGTSYSQNDVCRGAIGSPISPALGPIYQAVFGETPNLIASNTEENITEIA